MNRNDYREQLKQSKTKTHTTHDETVKIKFEQTVKIKCKKKMRKTNRKRTK